MSTTPPTDRTFRQRWTAFWFAPSDPTTLGFIRVMTGLLILYIHLTYSLDLQAFFGKYGWYGANYIERERKEFPLWVGSVTEWNDENVPPRLSEFPHRREAFLRFIRGLPERKAERAAALAYLDRTTKAEPGLTVQAMRTALGLALAPRLASDGPVGRKQDELLEGLKAGQQFYVTVDEHGNREYRPEPPRLGTPEPLFPPYFLSLQPDPRKDVANDLRAFLAVVPRDPVDAEYVFTHLVELDPASRRSLVEFLLTLPEDAAERARMVEYLEYWNNDARKAYRQGHWIFSVWFHVTDPTQMALIHALILVIIALFTAGVCTRVTSVLTWLAVVGYIHRTQQVLFGMDTMMNILLIYLVIGNSGAAVSVDRLVARYRAVRASLRRSGTVDEPTRAFLAAPPPSSGATLGIRLIQVHFCFIYLAAGLSKLKGPAWWSGFAFWDVMINPEFTLLRYPWFEEMVRQLAAIKPLYHTATALGVWFTWGLEISFPFLVWTRLRPVMLWLAVLLHAGIGVLMGLNLFELLMMVMLLVYLPPGVIRDRLRGGPGLPRLGFGFNPADQTHARAVAAVAAVDVDNQVAAEPRKAAGPPVLTAAGKSLTGPEAVAALFESVRLLRFARFVLWVPGVSGLLARVLFPAAGPPPAAGPGPKTGPQAPVAAS